jgi:hypothetical protein
MEYEVFVDGGRDYSSAVLLNTIKGNFLEAGHKIEELDESGWRPSPRAKMIISYDLEIPYEKLQKFHAKTGIWLTLHI